MAVYAIGDIHGCYSAFCRLLEKISFSATADRLWLVGDAVNRGADSLAVLRWLHAHQERVTMTLGNHDLHLLAVQAGAARAGGNDTLDDILSAPDGDALCGWLRRQPLAHYENDWLMIHAGALPMWDAEKILQLAAEVSAVVSGSGWEIFMQEMYGDTPMQWDESLTGAARWRVIINALTRLRICSPGGEMQLKFSGAPDTAPPPYLPWYDAPGRKSADTAIVCGHWSALGVMQRGNVHAIDSGCLWGGALSALRLDDQQLFQVQAE